MVTVGAYGGPRVCFKKICGFLQAKDPIKILKFNSKSPPFKMCEPYPKSKGCGDGLPSIHIFEGTFFWLLNFRGLFKRKNGVLEHPIMDERKKSGELETNFGMA